MKSQLACLALAVALAFGAAFDSSARAQGYDEYDEADAGQLSPEKQKALSEILKQNYTTVVPLRQQLAAKRGELNAELDSTNPDKEKITSLSREIGEIRGKLLAARVDARSQMARAGLPPLERYAYPQDWHQNYAPAPYYHGGWGHHWGQHGGWANPGWGGNGYCPWMDGRMMMGPMMGW